METIKNIEIKSIENKSLEDTLRYNIDHKTKPLGALGQLERMALQLGLIQQTTAPELRNPVILTVAADHDIIDEGFASAPKEVSWQQVLNFLSGGGAIGAMCAEVGIKLKVLDVGVDYDFEEHPDLLRMKVRKGTRNFLHEAAMTKDELHRAMNNGRKAVRQIAETGTNVIGFGEMGIGNTTPSSALLSVYCGISVEESTGFGAGINDRLLNLKIETIKKAIKKHGIADCPLENLRRFGGLEIAAIAGGMLEAAHCRMSILVDGFITTAAFLAAYKTNPLVKEYAFFAHSSKEKGHIAMLDYIDSDPILNLDLRLGEGTGAAMAFPILKCSLAMLNNMTSFSETKVFNVADSRL